MADINIIFNINSGFTISAGVAAVLLLALKAWLKSRQVKQPDKK